MSHNFFYDTRCNWKFQLHMPERFWRNISTHWQDAAVQHGAKRRGCHRHLLYSVSAGNGPLLYCSRWHLWFREIGTYSRISMIRIGIVACGNHQSQTCRVRNKKVHSWALKFKITSFQIAYSQIQAGMSAYLLSWASHQLRQFHESTKKHGAKVKVDSVKWSWSIQNPRRVLFGTLYIYIYVVS